MEASNEYAALMEKRLVDFPSREEVGGHLLTIQQLRGELEAIRVTDKQSDVEVEGLKGKLVATEAEKVALQTDLDSMRQKHRREIEGATPTLQPSRRCITMTPDDDSDSVRPTNDLERRPSRTRCLNFDTLEEEDGTVSDESNDEANDDEASDASSDEDSDASYDEISLLHSMIEEPKAETVKQNLPKLVNVIHKMFHSTNRTVITKEELLHKMIACQIEIVDRKEVEEQLRLMLQLVPDWISETKASFGDVLVSINKMSTPETVRARLEEATSQDSSTVS
ncbi:hypothetical protein IGI04_014555 [Brassica rapa subsp. trilocularis]|uniref:DNA replication factor Cdt1 C-terminal domain-containing protein n=1 Tax=Brassica rapa subsp. trilocularis TaxID=1813537 RepID=A0ABQ7MMI6_BRACM|nr:hypothetical protein IGI04_014555 [Brassica rapa subsp. trilocularis]